MFIQNTHHNSGISSSRELDITKLINDAKPVFKREPQCFESSSGGMNERAVNIEQQQPLARSRSGDLWLGLITGR